MLVKRITKIHKIFYCIFLFNIAAGLALTTSLPSWTYRSLQVLSILLLLYYFSSVKLKMTYTNIGQFCFVLYMVCSIFCFIRGVGDITYRDFLWSSEIYSLVIPIFGLCFYRLDHLLVLKQIAIVGIWIALFFCIFNFKTYFLDFAEEYQNVIFLGGYDHKIINRCSIPSLFVKPFLMTAFLFNYKRNFKVLAYITILFSFLALFLMGRRGGSFEIIAYVVIYIAFKLNRSQKLFLVVLLATLIVLYILPNYMNYTSDMIFFQRLEMDTRSGVEVDFIKDFNKNDDWLFGRGISGTYYCPTLLGLGQVNRSGMETGYLNFILKGGIIYLVSYLGILLYSVYLGFYRSKNIYSKYIAVVILFNLLMLYPGGYPSLIPSVIVLFAFVSFSQNKGFRTLSNNQLLEIFKTR